MSCGNIAIGLDGSKRGLKIHCGQAAGHKQQCFTLKQNSKEASIGEKYVISASGLPKLDHCGKLGPLLLTRQGFSYVF